MNVVKEIFAGVILVCFLPMVASAESALSNTIEVRHLKDGAVSPAATIADLSFVEGNWTGKALGGSVDELTTSAVDGQMMGMFRHLDADGALGFYEFFVFAEVGDTLVLRVKHFSPDLKGWEEKDDYVEFALVAIEGDAAYFDGLTYALTDDNTLVAAVEIKGRGVAEFHYTRRE